MSMCTADRRMGRWMTGSLLLTLILTVSGCGFGHNSAPAYLLDLGTPPNTAPATDQTSVSASTPSVGTPHREPVAIRFSGAQMLASTNVIWRVGDSANPQSYATYRWAAPPLQLVQQRIVEMLSTNRAVVQDGADPHAPLLQVFLTRFEQVYAPDGKSSTGQVSMQVVLVRNHRVEGSVLLSRSAPAPTQDAQGGAQALRTATDAATDELIRWLEQQLRQTTTEPGS